MKFKTVYSKDDPVFSCQGCEPSITDQAAEPLGNLNSIVERFRVSGFAPLSFYANQTQPVYGDAVGIKSWEESANTMIRFNAYFDSLPSDVKKRFHTPENFARYCTDPETSEKALEEGFLFSEEFEQKRNSEKKSTASQEVKGEPSQTGGDSPSA